MKTWGMAIGAVMLAGCMTASVDLAGEAEQKAAQSFAPPSGHANLYVVRDGGYMSGGMVLFRVIIDGRDHGSLAQWTYLVMPVPPGPHNVLSSTAESQEAVKFDAEAGRNYFVSIKSRIGWASGRVSVSMLPEDRGREVILKARLARRLM